MNGKKFGEAIAIGLALCALAVVAAGTVKLIIWMF